MDQLAYNANHYVEINVMQMECMSALLLSAILACVLGSLGYGLMRLMSRRNDKHAAIAFLIVAGCGFVPAFWHFYLRWL